MQLSYRSRPCFRVGVVSPFALGLSVRAGGDLVVVVAVVVFALVILVAAVSDVSDACLNVVIIATYDVFSLWRLFLWLSHMETFFVAFALVKYCCCFRRCFLMFQMLVYMLLLLQPFTSE